MILLLSIQLNAQQSGAYRVALYENDPLIFSDEKGSPQGLFIELLEAMKEQESWEIEYVRLSWGEALQALYDGEIDLIACIAFLESRKPLIDYTEESVLSMWGQVYTSSHIHLDSLFSLDDRYVGVMTGGSNGKNFIKICRDFGVEPKIREYPDYEDIFQALENEEIRAGVTNNIAGYRLEMEYEVNRSPLLFSPFSLHFAVPENRNKELLSSINGYLRTWKEEKSSPYYRALNRWIYQAKEGAGFSIPWRWIGLTAAVILILLLLSLSLRVQVRRRTRDLQLSREQYRSIAEDMPVMICRFDPEMKISYVNRSYCSYYGRTSDEFIGADPLCFLDREEIERLRDKLNRLTRKEPTVQSDHPIHLEDHTIRRQQWIFRALFSPSGELTGYQSIGQDVTEKYNLQEQLLQQNKMDAMGSLAGGIAHDFNNILMAILNSTELLLSPDLGLSDKGRSYIEIIRQAGNRASQLVEKLLTFSRKSPIAYKKHDLHRILEDTVSILEQTIDKRIRLTLNKGAGKSIIRGNASALESALLNLGINASHAIEGKGEISFSSDNLELTPEAPAHGSFDLPPGLYLRIRVRDSGSGIDPAIISRIFDPFFTTKKEGEGTGMGLAAVYSTLQEHLGSVDVESIPGEGTLFTLLLPCDENHTDDFFNKKEESQRGCGTILYADDEELNRISGRDLLENLGYSIILAKDGREALEIFRERQKTIDLVLLDLIMPEMNGKEALLAIHALSPETPIIMSSGFTRDEDIEALKKEGLSAFIQKPFRLNELSRLLLRHIEK